MASSLMTKHCLLPLGCRSRFAPVLASNSSELLNRRNVRTVLDPNAPAKLPNDDGLEDGGENDHKFEPPQNQQEPIAEPHFYAKPPEGMVKAPHWTRGFPKRGGELLEKYNRLKRDEVKHLGEADTADGARLYDYYRVQEHVNKLPTLKHKIDFVNPFERHWIDSEKKWIRKFMPAMVAPRKVWLIPPTPPFYDMLDFYKYITKTRLVDGEEAVDAFENYYKGVNLPTAKFEKRLVEVMQCHFDALEGDDLKADFAGGLSWDDRNELARRRENLAQYLYRKNAEQQNTSRYHKDTGSGKLLQAITQEALLAIAHGNAKKFLDRRVSYTARCESFWIRSGFRSLYNTRQIYLPQGEIERRRTRITTDDRRYLGEFVFTARDQLVANIRANTPTKNLFEWSDKEQLEAPVFPPEFNVVDNVIYFPKMFNLHDDDQPIFQCPGYDYDVDETHKFGRFAVKDMAELNTRIATHWRPSTPLEHQETLGECLKAQSVVSLFNWLNGQAHCLGHTQYTDVEAPLTSQFVLSDGRMFFFALGQLNTVAINIDVQGFHNPRTNVCVVDGPHWLYENFDPATGKFQHSPSASEGRSSKKKLVDGLNPYVLHRFLQICTV